MQDTSEGITEDFMDHRVGITGQIQDRNSGCGKFWPQTVVSGGVWRDSKQFYVMAAAVVLQGVKKCSLQLLRSWLPWGRQLFPFSVVLVVHRVTTLLVSAFRDSNAISRKVWTLLWFLMQDSQLQTSPIQRKFRKRNEKEQKPAWGFKMCPFITTNVASWKSKPLASSNSRYQQSGCIISCKRWRECPQPRGFYPVTPWHVQKKQKAPELGVMVTVADDCLKSQRDFDFHRDESSTATCSSRSLCTRSVFICSSLDCY